MSSHFVIYSIKIIFCGNCNCNWLIFVLRINKSWWPIVEVHGQHEHRSLVCGRSGWWRISLMFQRWAFCYYFRSKFAFFEFYLRSTNYLSPLFLNQEIFIVLYCINNGPYRIPLFILLCLNNYNWAIRMLTITQTIPYCRISQRNSAIWLVD